MANFEVKRNNALPDFKNLSSLEGKFCETTFDGVSIKNKEKLFGMALFEYFSIILKAANNKDKLQIEDFIGNYTCDIYDILKSSYKFDATKLKKLYFEKGILHVTFLNGKKEVFNIIPESYSNNPKINTEAFIRKNTRQKTCDLKEGINIEPYYLGKLLVSYSVIPGTGLYVISKVKFKQPDGKYAEVSLSSKESPKMSKAEHGKNLIKTLKQNGVEFEPNSGCFEKSDKAALSKAMEKVNEIKYEDIKSKNPSITKNEFESTKYKFLKRFAKRLSTSTLSHIESTIFMPVFFREYYANSSDPVALAKSLSEMGLFMVGAGFGAEIAPGILKAPASLIFGALFTFGGEFAGSKMNLEKKSWKYAYEKEDLFEKTGSERGKGVVLHILTAGATHDVLDKITGKRDFDIGLPFTKGGLDISLFGKHLFTVPDINFIQSSIDLSTSPREYMSKGISRDKDFWNNKVDNYNKWLKKEVSKLIDDYRFGRNPFGENKKETQKELFERLDKIGFGNSTKQISTISFQPLIKKSKRSNDEIFREKLDEIFKGSGEYKGFEESIIAIKKTIMKDYKNGGKENIGFIIDNELSLLKIDDHFLLERKMKNDKLGLTISDIIHGASKKTIKEIENQNNILSKYKKSNPKVAVSLPHQIGVKEVYANFANLIEVFKNDPKKQQLADKIIERLLKHEKILKTNAEKKLYHEIIDSKAGDEFVVLLNMITEYKREKEFLENLQNTGYGVEWKL